jgi:hypothetical protein
VARPLPMDLVQIDEVIDWSRRELAFTRAHRAEFIALLVADRDAR